jgi:hypothetical protein
VYYIFYVEKENTYELLGRATTIERAKGMKEYYNKTLKIPENRINIMKIVG